jgi:hypothetical protein
MYLMNKQRNHFYRAKIWSGISTVQGIESTRTDQEPTEQHEPVTGKLLVKTGWFTLISARLG